MGVDTKSKVTKVGMNCRELYFHFLPLSNKQCQGFGGLTAAV